ncbi:MAG: DUF4271 domain-containing protein [Sphingobacteriales bacterium JAD_PAG50586_3]|nr:MAG: DUF4271 domain-containing protein [Sphingobacteriales bacterium JAD_PAG50586_3]
MKSTNPFTSAVKPDTVDFTTSAGNLSFLSAPKEGTVLVFPKGYVPETKENRYVKSPFAKHELKAKSFKTEERRPGEGWVFVSLIGIFVLLLLTRRLNPKKLVTYLSAIYNRRAQNELFEEENLLSSPFSLILFVAFCLTASLFTIKAIGLTPSNVIQEYGAFATFGIFSVILLVVYTFKILFIQFIGSVFNIYPVARQYAFNVYLLNNILGLLLIPLVAIAYYSGGPADTWAVYAGIVLFIVFFVLRFLKSLSIEGIISPFNLMYLFLYLCTLEILPLLVVVKLIAKY